MTQTSQVSECRIWCFEETPQGTHWCHARSKGLAGGLYPRDSIDRILEEKATGPKDKWVLMACEPSHDGSACEGCNYLPKKGLSQMYDRVI